MKNGPSPAIEAEYIVPGETSVDAITRSLQSLLPTRQRQIARQRFTVLDTFDGRVRRARACLTRRGHNGDSTVGWQPPDGESHLTLRLKQPVAFAWDLPDGPLHQALAPVIGPRRLLDQANAEEEGALLEILDDCGKTVARLKIASGPGPAGRFARRLVHAAHDDDPDGAPRLRRRVRAARPGD